MRKNRDLSRKTVRARRRGGAAVTALILLLASASLAACRKPVVSQETVTESSEEAGETEDAEPEDMKTATMTAVGEASRMIESGGRLYFKYENTIRAIDGKTGETELLRTFDGEEVNNSFWVYAGGLYFDSCRPGSGDDDGFYGLYRLDLETGEEEHLADLMAQPALLYASEDRLYIKGYDRNTVVYALGKDGKTSGELAPSETVYGRIPDGCQELFTGMLPQITEECGYMPVQNENCLVIAEADGSNPREVPEVTNTSSILFTEDGFFKLFGDGSGGTTCYRYDINTLERTLVFEAGNNPGLIQYRDGYLYYMVNDISGIVSSDVSFFRVKADGTGTAALTASVREEAGMTGDFLGYGNFFVSEDAVYCQQFKDYGVYMGKAKLTDGACEMKLLEPMLYQSPLSQLGRVDVVYEEIPCSCGEYTAGEIYVEKLIFDGDDEAAKAMNEVMEKTQEQILAYAREGVKSVDEEWLHQDSAGRYSLTFVLDGKNIHYLDENYVCIGADGYEYTGGAHGTPFREYFVFDRKTGARLGLQDITDNTQEELQSIVGSAFRQLAERTNFAFESPEDLEHTVSDSVSYDSPFYLTEKGIVFYYDPYAIASYAEGFPQVLIPYGDLKLKINLK